MHTIFYFLLGMATGVLSGFVGIGGGIVLVPSLVYLFGLSQHQAQGTTLAALIPPIGILAAWVYYKQGYVNLKIAILLSLGIFLGAFLGSKIAVTLPSATLQKIFGIVLFGVALKMIF